MIRRCFPPLILPTKAPLDPPNPCHTRQWGYINTVMDASGRILPSACAPAPRQNLVFGQLDPDNPAPDLLNTPPHQSARAYFSTGLPTTAGHHCQHASGLTPNTRPTLMQYAAAIHPPILNSATRNWLSDWTA